MLLNRASGPRPVVPRRDLRWLSITLAAVIALWGAGCLGGDAEPVAVPLGDLVADQDGYDGTAVIAEGTVQTFDAPRHYWIEDADQHRVELFPHEAVEELVGQRVRVTGEFTFVDDRGRGIDIEDLEVLEERPQATSPPRPPNG